MIHPHGLGVERHPVDDVQGLCAGVDGVLSSEKDGHRCPRLSGIDVHVQSRYVPFQCLDGVCIVLSRNFRGTYGGGRSREGRLLGHAIPGHHHLFQQLRFRFQYNAEVRLDGYFLCLHAYKRYLQGFRLFRQVFQFKFPVSVRDGPLSRTFHQDSGTDYRFPAFFRYHPTGHFRHLCSGESDAQDQTDGPCSQDSFHWLCDFLNYFSFFPLWRGVGINNNMRACHNAESLSKCRVILNEVKNLNT